MLSTTRRGSNLQSPLLAISNTDFPSRCHKRCLSPGRRKLQFLSLSGIRPAYARSFLGQSFEITIRCLTPCNFPLLIFTFTKSSLPLPFLLPPFNLFLTISPRPLFPLIRFCSFGGGKTLSQNDTAFFAWLFPRFRCF